MAWSGRSAQASQTTLMEKGPKGRKGHKLLCPLGRLGPFRPFL